LWIFTWTRNSIGLLTWNAGINSTCGTIRLGPIGIGSQRLKGVMNTSGTNCRVWCARRFHGDLLYRICLDDETADLAAQFSAFPLLDKGNLRTELIPLLREIVNRPAD
jgi:hypothetical protein